MSVRADVLLVQRGLVQSRTKARDAIEMGIALADGLAIEKPAQILEEGCVLTLTRKPYKYVSRAGDKLEAALESFGINPQNAICLDIGASTGGFTDCLIQRGAKCVFAVDVGKAQLDSTLLSNPKVVSIEETDIRLLEKEKITPPTLVAADVSFISLSLIFPSIVRLMGEGADVICLIKPQFEAGRAALNKSGVVTSPKDHIRVINEVIAQAFSHSLSAIGLIPSPIKGGSGNTEYLIHLKHGVQSNVTKPQIEAAVKEAICK